MPQAEAKRQGYADEHLHQTSVVVMADVWTKDVAAEARLHRPIHSLRIGKELNDCEHGQCKGEKRYTPAQLSPCALRFGREKVQPKKEDEDGPDAVQDCFPSRDRVARTSAEPLPRSKDKRSEERRVGKECRSR